MSRKAKSKKTGACENTLRIIAGSCRGRKIQFANNIQLRPTADRIRETLFNWLQTDIYQACCLDLFAGSGILGLEALSRGAAKVYAVESDFATCQMIEAQAVKLAVNDLIVINRSVYDFLSKVKSNSEYFDIVFIDPPYKDQVLLDIFHLLQKHNCLSSRAKIYFESNYKIDESQLPSSWLIIKRKKAGQVNYYLAEYQNLNEAISVSD